MATQILPIPNEWPKKEKVLGNKSRTRQFKFATQNTVPLYSTNSLVRAGHASTELTSNGGLLRGERRPRAGVTAGETAPFSKRKPLRRVSPKMRRQLVEYRAAKAIWWAARLEIDGGRCQFVDDLGNRCQRVASTSPHHIYGRGPYLSDPSTFAALCFEDHNWVHEHPNEARRKGLLK